MEDSTQFPYDSTKTTEESEYQANWDDFMSNYEDGTPGSQICAFHL